MHSFLYVKSARVSKDYIHMNESISESNCVCELILPGSVSTSSEAMGFSY